MYVYEYMIETQWMYQLFPDAWIRHIAIVLYEIAKATSRGN